ncbi:hypothetical protein D9M68_549160 [compost metagenome]
MRLLHVGQGVALVDRDLHRAALHHREQVVGHGLRALARGDVREQRRARHVERTLRGQQAEADRRHRARAVAEDRQQAKGAQAVDGAFEGVLANRVIHHLHPLATGDFLHACREVLGAVVDGVRRAVRQRELALGIAAGRADELQAERLGPLAGDEAHAAGRGMEQHEVARLQAFGGQRLLQQVLRGEALEHHGRAGLEGDVVGQFAHALGGHHAQFAVGAGRLARVGGAVAHLQVRHALAHCLDDARGFHAQLQRHLERVQAGALVGVDEVQAHGLVADADLAGAGLAHLDLDDLQFLGTAVAVDTDGFAQHRCCLHAGEKRMGRASCHV